jgi:hypothetical protein
MLVQAICKRHNARQFNHNLPHAMLKTALIFVVPLVLGVNAAMAADSAELAALKVNAANMGYSLSIAGRCHYADGDFDETDWDTGKDAWADEIDTEAERIGADRDEMHSLTEAAFNKAEKDIARDPPQVLCVKAAEEIQSRL